jgi:hypothetical protein
VLDDSLHAGDGPAPSIQDRPIGIDATGIEDVAKPESVDGRSLVIGV